MGIHEIDGCKNDARKADVVFVHGLGGDAFGTWKYGKDEASSFPHMLAQDFPQVGVWSLGIRGWFPGGDRDAGHGMPLPRRAKQVLDLLDQRGLGERPLFLYLPQSGWTGGEAGSPKVGRRHEGPVEQGI